MALRKNAKRLRTVPPTFSQDDQPPLSLEPINDDHNPEDSSMNASHQPQALSPIRSVAGSEIQSPAPSMQSKSSRGGRTKKKKQPTPRRGGNEQASEIDDSETTSEMDDSSLYDLILNNRLSPKQLAHRWIENYKTDKDRALLSLNEFFLNSSACNGRITPEMQGVEDSVIIRHMIDKLDPEDGEYPVIKHGQKWHKFRERFVNFVQQIVLQSRNSIIYDQVLLTKVSNFLVALSDSQVRAFRHTATLAAMKLTTALVEVASEVSKNLRITTRQIDAENKKTGGRPGERFEALTATFEELEENFTDLKEKLDALFSSVFVFRYIDVLADIRVICMFEVGNWMAIFPELFLNDRYLKYVGWNLYDKASEVRLECIQSLLPLYESDRFKPKLEGFTSKFKDRIVAMVLDKDSAVAVEAVKLVTEILKYYREFLTDADCEHVFELVYSSDRNVAQATGCFLKERLFTLDEDSVVGLRSARGKQRLPNTPLIRDLVLFFIEAELHEHGAYLVDSLIDSNPMIKDWECMTDLLLEDAGPQEEPLSNQAESCLIDIMVCSVKQAATGEGPVGRARAKKVHSKTELNQIAEDKKKLTEHFIPTLPYLLEKYRADPEKLSNLLTIPQYFDLSVYTTLRQEQNLDALLRKINEIVANVQQVDALETAAKTLEFLCLEDSPIFAQTNVARSLLIDSIVNRYKEAVEKYGNEIANSDLPDEDEVFNVVLSLKKLSIFYCSHDINSWDIQDSLFRIIEEYAEHFPNEAIIYCIIACRFSLLWAQNSLTHSVDNEDTELTNKARQLKQRLDNFMESMMYFVDSGRPNVSAAPEVKEEAYSTICDLLVIFSNQLRNNVRAWVHLLVYEVDHHMQAILNRYVQERVFTEESAVAERDEQQKIEELHKRRNLLAGYCKLIAYNIMPTKYAADVFKHYVKFYNDYGDIIRTTIGKARSINKVNCALTMLHSLINLWLEVVAEKQQMEMNYDDSKPIKELARRFALQFSFQASVNRHAVTALHRAGINFAIAPSDQSATNLPEPPPNLGFLEVLEEFTKKLLKQDKRPVLDYLNSKVQGIAPPNPGKEWKSLIFYRNSLMPSGTEKATAASRRRKEHDETGNNEENAADDQSKVTRSKKKKPRVARNNPLPVTKVAIPRGTKSPSLQDTHLTLTPDSSVFIDDSSQYITEENLTCGEEDDVESVVLETRPKHYQPNQKMQQTVRYPMATELFGEEELMDVGAE